MSFTGKVVIVTGAACGIGSEISLILAEQSAKLVLVDILDEELKNTAKKCAQFNTEVLPIKADITKDVEVNNVVKETLRAFKKIDILINSAGKFVIGGVLNDNIMTALDVMYNVNLKSIVLLTHLVAPELIKTKGCIVNISSIGGIAPQADMVAYSTMKAALTHYTKCVALELAAKGVRVNSVSPGPVKTGILLRSGLSHEQMEMMWNSFVDLSPTKTGVSTEDVAKLAVYLASDDAKSITGVDYVIDNGFLLGGSRS